LDEKYRDERVELISLEGMEFLELEFINRNKEY
jgi:hypothetical protein